MNCHSSSRSQHPMLLQVGGQLWKQVATQVCGHEGVQVPPQEFGQVAGSVIAGQPQVACGVLSQVSGFSCVGGQ